MLEHFTKAVGKIKNLRQHSQQVNRAKAFYECIRLSHDPTKLMSCRDVEKMFILPLRTLVDLKLILNKRMIIDFLAELGHESYSLSVIRRDINAKAYRRMFKRDSVIYDRSVVMTCSEALYLLGLNGTPLDYPDELREYYDPSIEENQDTHSPAIAIQDAARLVS